MGCMGTWVLGGVVALTISACGVGGSATGASTNTDSGVVTATGFVGALRVDRSTASDIRRLAGPPSFAGTGRTTLGPAFEAFGYSCSRRWVKTQGINPGGERRTHVWCRTVYFVRLTTRKLASFWTDARSFETANGSRPGMRQRTVDRLEHRHAYAHALTGISGTTRTASLFIENIGCRPANPGGDPERTPCLGGRVRSLIVEGHHPVGLLGDAFPSWNR